MVYHFGVWKSIPEFTWPGIGVFWYLLSKSEELMHILVNRCAWAYVKWAAGCISSKGALWGIIIFQVASRNSFTDESFLEMELTVEVPSVSSCILNACQHSNLQSLWVRILQIHWRCDYLWILVGGAGQVSWTAQCVCPFLCSFQVLSSSWLWLFCWLCSSSISSPSCLLGVSGIAFGKPFLRVSICLV